MPDQNENESNLHDAIAGLRDAAPHRDLWPDIRSQLRPRRPGFLQVRWPVALAAGLALVVATAAGTAVILSRTDISQPIAATTVQPGRVIAAGHDGDADAARAVVEMEAALASSAASLDPAVYRALAKGLAILDRAIVDASAQQRAAPADPAARQYLTSMMQRKLDVLRTAERIAMQQS